MRFRGVSMLALAAFALSGLVAPAAMAEEVGETYPGHPGKSPLTVCDATDTGGEECAPQIWLSPEEMEAVSPRIVKCLESDPNPHGSGRAFAEKCVAAATSGGAATTSGHANRAHRAKRAHRRRHAKKN